MVQGAGPNRRKSKRHELGEQSTQISGLRPVVRGPASSTLAEYTAERLAQLCRSAGFGSETASVVATWKRLVEPWGNVPASATTPWISDISDDNTPVEFSVAMVDGRADVRVLFEPQASKPTVRAYRDAGLAFHKRIEREFGADLTRFRLVQDLFLAEDMQGPFAVWSSVVFSPGRAPTFKSYFNPLARGAAQSYAIVDAALRRLGFPQAWASLCRTVARRGPHLDELKYLALDLSSAPLARVKVYLRHHGATLEDIEVAASAAEDYVAGEAVDFIRSVAGERETLRARAPFTCSAFVQGRGDHPVATTLYVPVCAYADNDAAVRERVTDHLANSPKDRAAYERIVDGFANRALDTGTGMQSWVAHRRFDDTTRMTVYLATEARRVYPPGTIPAGTADRLSFASAEDVIRCTASYSLADHPFVERLKRQKDCSGPLWLLIRNTYEGTSRHFVRWLATVTAHVEDDAMRSLLARQLDQELGEGDISRAHSNLMRDFLEAIEPLRPHDLDESVLVSGRRLGQALGQHYMSDDPYEGLAALMAGEICAEQLIRSVGELLGAQPIAVDEKLLSWLTQHNELEGNHADESFMLARRIPSEPKAVEAVARGALGLHRALWRSLDELYLACFGTDSTAGTTA